MAAKASVAAGLRFASRARSSAGRPGSAMAAAMPARSAARAAEPAMAKAARQVMTRLRTKYTLRLVTAALAPAAARLLSWCKPEAGGAPGANDKYSARTV